MRVRVRVSDCGNERGLEGVIGGMVKKREGERDSVSITAATDPFQILQACPANNDRG